MAIPLLHTVVSWLLKKRVHDIELFIKYPNEVQRDELTNLLQTAKKKQKSVSSMALPICNNTMTLPTEFRYAPMKK
jgi:hypothetical protein